MMFDHILLAEAGSFSDVWPYIAATAAAIGGPLLVAIRWQATTYAEEKKDLIARLDANNAEHRKEMRELLLPAIQKMTTAIENDIESNGELGSDLRDLKTAMDIYFGPKNQGG
jgi:hypothetical protein